MTTLATRRSPERQQFLLDLLTTACEGGIGYWCFIDQYQIWENPGAPNEDLVQKPDPQLRIFDYIGAEKELPDDANYDHWKHVAQTLGWEALPEEHRYLLNIEVIARGLRRCWENGNPKPGSYWEQLFICDRTNGRSGDYDSELADQIVQWGLWGKGVYG